MTPSSIAIVSDAHLGPGARAARSCSAVASLVAACSARELCFNGDLFQLSAVAPGNHPGRFLGALFEACPALKASLRARLGAGAPVVLVAGNHDASISRPEFRRTLLEALGLLDSAPLSVAPWFLRRGDLHIEHGHLYDPDNAPSHPLVAWSPATEGIGTALTRRFLVPFGALEFLHAHECTPWSALSRTVRLYGHRAPRVIVGYFWTAFNLWAEAGHSVARERERVEGSALLARQAAAAGVDVTVIERLLQVAPQPTHLDRTETFFRLYLDRSLAAGLAICGLLGWAAGAGLVTGGVSLASAGYVLTSVARSPSRYRGLLEVRLRQAAEQIAELSRARWVILGHSHIVDRGPSYINPGSFAHTDGHPYVIVRDGLCPEVRSAFQDCELKDPGTGPPSR